MLRIRWSGAGGSARKAPPSRIGKAGARVTLVALALVALSQGGCTMLGIGGDGCSPCRTGLKLPRLFHHKRAAADCGPGCAGEVGGMPMEGSAPVMGAPATIAPSSPAGEPDIKPIDPAPTSGAAPKPDAATGSAARKSDYQTYRPARRATVTPLANLGGGRSRPRSLPPLEPTPRSASERPVATLDDPLENLPAPEVAKAAGADSPPRSGLPDAPPAVLPKPKPDPEPPPAAAASALDPGPVPQAQAEPDPGAVPGILRFHAVEPQLAGGSFPDAGGWAWLAEKRYRTVLDLREAGQMGPNDLAAISHEGFRYIAMPVTAKGIDADLLRRFDRELAQSDARPLFFCDADGTRPAALWYLHRVVTQKADRQAARREAESIAPMDGAFERAATTLLETLDPPKAAVLTPESAPVAEAAARPEAEEPAAAPRAVEASEPAAPASDPVPVAAIDAADLRPYMALGLAVLGVPLAFWGGSSFGLFRVKRASLPAPRHAPKSLPPASGA